MFQLIRPIPLQTEFSLPALRMQFPFYPLRNQIPIQSLRVRIQMATCVTQNFYLVLLFDVFLN